MEREFGLHDYYLSNESFIDDAARAVPPQYCPRHEDEHTVADPLTLSPSWRDSHARRHEHLEMPPEVFM